MKIPLYRPSLTQVERDLVLECVDSTWISSKGEFIGKFEKSFSEFTSIEYPIAVSNGTVAIHLALEGLGIGPGDEVIVPTFTYVASVNPIRYTGARPVFVDSLASSWQLDPQDIAKKITEKTRAIIVVHLYGQACEMEPILALARKHRLFVIEDCAEAFGTRYRGQHVGGFGQVGTFSFFGNKTITTGEGGMVVTRDPVLRGKMDRLKGQGLVPNREYWHDVVGYNYRMTNICAAIGVAQLGRATALIQRKREIAKSYQEQLQDTPVLLHAEQPNTVHSYWMNSLLVPKADQRDRLREHLKGDGIETRPAFYPVHTMPMYLKAGERFPIAEDLASRGMNLPSWPGLSAKEVTFVADSVRRFFRA